MATKTARRQKGQDEGDIGNNHKAVGVIVVARHPSMLETCQRVELSGIRIEPSGMALALPLPLTQDIPALRNDRHSTKGVVIPRVGPDSVFSDCGRTPLSL